MNVNVGDTVLVKANDVGRGFPAVRLRAEVLQVTAASLKLKFLDRKKWSADGKWVDDTEWVDESVVTDIVF